MSTDHRNPFHALKTDANGWPCNAKPPRSFTEHTARVVVMLDKLVDATLANKPVPMDMLDLFALKVFADVMRTAINKAHTEEVTNELEADDVLADHDTIAAGLVNAMLASQANQE